jgi:hypothetical protein
MDANEREYVAGFACIGVYSRFPLVFFCVKANDMPKNRWVSLIVLIAVCFAVGGIDIHAT